MSEVLLSTVSPSLYTADQRPRANPYESQSTTSGRRDRSAGRMAVALAPLAPLDTSNAPPSPTLQPIAKAPSVSPLALFAAEMMSWLWFAPGRTKSGTDREGGDEVPEVAKLQVQPTERFVRFCQEVLSTSEWFLQGYQGISE